jgi:hypothetical protein
MTADKRSTHTDALETLGFVLFPEQGERDAIHLAVEPVIAGHKLSPGEHIGIKDGKAVSHHYKRNQDVKLLGVVDSFLTRDVEAGERFWLVVYPRQITSLRHVWSHPDFSDSTDVMFPNVDGKDNAVLYPPPMTEKDKAYKWIENYANSLSGYYSDYEGGDSYAEITAEELIDTAKTHLKEGSWGDYIVYGGKFEGEYVQPEFWNQLEIYLEKEIPEDRRHSFFSCSC